MRTQTRESARAKGVTMVRLVSVLGLVGLLFIAFAGMSIFDGKGRDGIESGIAGVVFLAVAFLLGRRYFFPSDRRRLEKLGRRARK